MANSPTAMRLSELLDGLAEISSVMDAQVSGMSMDSRTVKSGDAFIALQGATRHGMEFAQVAAARGAKVILAEPSAQQFTVNAPVLTIPNLRSQLGSIAQKFFNDASAKLSMIGVTGTNGKTSTVQLIGQALHRAGICVGTIGTLGAGVYPELKAGERTTPDVIATHGLIADLASNGATHLAMEVSSHALDQGRVDGVKYDLAVFTNLTHDHLDYHGDMQSYGAAKAKLFAWQGLRAAVINTDDAFGAQLLETIPSELTIYSYGLSPEAKFRAEKVEPKAQGLSFMLHTPEGVAPIESSLIGVFNVYNLLAVAASLAALNWSLQKIAQALNQLQAVPGRMNSINGTTELPLLVVDYAHTPDALEKALQAVRNHTTGKLIVVFGCGGNRDSGKRPLMGRIAEQLADVVIVTDDNPRTESGDEIVAAIVAGMQQPKNALVERNRQLAIRSAFAAAVAGDCVLIAGKGHETYQEVAGQFLEFDDMQIAQRELARVRDQVKT